MIGKIASALLGDTLDTVLDRVVPDLNARKEAKEELNKALVDAANASLLAQIEVNKTEAAHPSTFVSGWRPMCGWVCGSALAYNFIIHPLLGYMLLLSFPETPALPALDLEPLMTVLLGMLGLGGLRTYEKTQGVARQGWGRPR
jgi:hypothetical protein